MFFRFLFSFLSGLLNRKEAAEKEAGEELTRNQFDMLTYLEKNGRQRGEPGQLAERLGVSAGKDEKLIRELDELNYINILQDGVEISEKGLKALEPYRVRKAIILAAGFGSRLAPVTLDTPKPLVRIKGVRILDTLLDALIGKGITNITIVRGYKKEQFDELLEKYPGLSFIDNPEYNVTNNISSAVAALDRIDRCYICEADLWISNPDVINKYEYRSNYLGTKVAETEDWCLTVRNGVITDYQRGGTDCYQAYGISYWNSEDAEKLKTDLMRVYHARAGKENLWEMVPLKIARKNYSLEIRECKPSDITEIDNFSELVAVDPSYANYPGHEAFNG